MAKRCGFVLLRPIREAETGAARHTKTSERMISDDVARRAYEIYQREGRPSGRQIEHWVQAERELASLA